MVNLSLPLEQQQIILGHVCDVTTYLADGCAVRRSLGLRVTSHDKRTLSGVYYRFATDCATPSHSGCVTDFPTQAPLHSRLHGSCMRLLEHSPSPHLLRILLHLPRILRATHDSTTAKLTRPQNIPSKQTSRLHALDGSTPNPHIPRFEKVEL